MKFRIKQAKKKKENDHEKLDELRINVHRSLVRASAQRGRRETRETGKQQALSVGTASFRVVSRWLSC